MGRFLPLIVGLVSVPLTLMFDTDSFFFGMLPVLIGIGKRIRCKIRHILPLQWLFAVNCATFISPVVPATFLGTGLAGVEIKDHIKKQFLLDLGCKYYLSDLRYNSWSYQNSS